MAALFAVLLVLHGLVHLLGVAKAFGLARLPQLAQPIGPAAGIIWLAAAVLMTSAGVALLAWPRWWWAIGAAALVCSTIAIAASWADAKAGAVVNVVVFAGVVFGFLAQGPFSLRAQYDRDVAALAPPAAAAALAPITEADLAHLPPPVQHYLRTAGVVGQPRVRTFFVRMHGRIRSGRDARWMPFAAEQHNAIDPAARLFYLTASMFLIPVQGYHRYADGSASMLIKAGAMLPVARESGSAMAQAETVTFFNDMCVMAPATLIDRAIAWEQLDARLVRATFPGAGHTVRAGLAFNERGELVDFWSEDRYQSMPGQPARQVRWSTPLGEYQRFGTVRLASRGEGRWHDAEGDYAYIEVTIDEVAYNPPDAAAAAR
jgi:hypothetical protein